MAKIIIIKVKKNILRSIIKGEIWVSRGRQIHDAIEASQEGLQYKNKENSNNGHKTSLVKGI
jgi:hypothetical protein